MLKIIVQCITVKDKTCTVASEQTVIEMGVHNAPHLLGFSVDPNVEDQEVRVAQQSP